MGRNSSKVNSIARQIIAELKISTKDLAKGPRGFTTPQILWFHHSQTIEVWLKKLKPSSLGEIIACGKGWEGIPKNMTALHEVEPLKYSPYESGQRILLSVATRAVVAEIADILLSRLCRDCGYELVNGRCNNCQITGFAQTL